MAKKVAAILENDPSTGDITAKLFQESGMEVKGTKTVKELQDFLSGETPEIITLDIQSTKDHGLEICENISKDDNLKNVPILIISSSKDREIIREYLKAGANDYLEKPFSREEFLTRTENILRNKNLKDELLARNHELDVAGKAKSEFLANMSHEIRTPINGIIGMLRFLLEEELSSKQEEYAQIAFSSAEALLTVINDILDYSKIATGKLEMEEIPFNLESLVEDMSASVAPNAIDKNTEFILRYHNNHPRHFIGDPGRVRQILLNLTTNAIKFTDEGHVLIQIDAEIKDNALASITVKVEDTGIGMSKEQIKKIFNKFEQADSTTTRKFGGTGLGLAISKQLTDIMRGNIIVNSEVGVGTSFSFHVNLPIAEKEAKSHDLKDRYDLDGQKVLIVEDYLVTRAAFEEQIAGFNGDCKGVETGENALAELISAANSKNPYSIVFMNAMMPGMNGEELARAIKAIPSLKDTKLILVASTKLRIGREKLQEIGFSDYLTKPIRRTSLEKSFASLDEGNMEQVDSLKQSPSEVKNHKADQKHAEEKTSPMGHLNTLLVEDNQVNQLVARKMLEQLGCKVEAVSDGKLAVEALEDKKYDIVFMDCQMPVMDGYEATLKIREKEGKDKHTNIIALTANVLEKDRQKCFDAGMDDFITKPIDPKALKDIIDNWGKIVIKAESEEEPHENSFTKELDENELFDDSPADQPEEEDYLDGELIINPDQLISAIGDDAELIQKIIDTFVDSFQEKFDFIKSSVFSEDQENIGRHSHSLKGSAANIGANRLMSVAKRIEKFGKSGDYKKSKKEFENLKPEFDAFRREIKTIDWEGHASA